MHCCCVLGCGTKPGGKNFHTTFHAFPSYEDLSLRKEWISAVGRINWEPALSSRVCSKHFKDTDFYKLKKAKRLRKDAVPSINVGLCDTLKMAKMNAKECVIPTCSSQFSEAPYFHFPKDKSLCLKWLLAIPKGGWSLSQESQVCSRHFEKQDVVMNESQAWLRTGSVPKLYLGSPTIVGKEILPPESKTEVTFEESQVELDSDAGKPCTDNAAPGPSEGPEESTPSTSQDVELIQEGNDTYKIKLDADGGSESDLEIIEPEIETYEVSDTSDEEQPPPRPALPTPKGPLLTSLNCRLQINEIRNATAKSNVIVKPPGSSAGRVIRGDAKIKCCVPRCGSMAGNPSGVGFHSFPQVGETRLSVRSLDNKLTVHDLFSMWKSLLSVTTITKDSYVCTRHFTPNDYSGNVLNKVAVPTQFLPTPVTFAPCKVQEKVVAVQPPPLVLLNKSKNPPPILRKSHKPPFTYATPPIRFPGIPCVNNVSSLTRVTNNRVEPAPTRIFHRLAQPNTSTNKLKNIAPRPLQAPKSLQAPKPLLALKSLQAPKPVQPLVRPVPPPMPKKLKLGCSITDCPNKQHDGNSKAVLFRLPHNIEKCKEWVYSCGHPEWLDKGMILARSVYRICLLHFEDEMFLDAGHKTLKGSAKPTVAVQEPYKKCIVKHCHNYYDKERLHYIGVDFATFPTESDIFNCWVKAVKNNTGVPAKSIKLTEDDVTNFTGAVICSLHFRNSDYMAGPNGKSLSPKAIPSMNLVYVKEHEVSPPAPEATKEPPSNSSAQSSELRAAISAHGRGQYVQRAKRRPYLGRKRRRGRKPGWLKSIDIVGNNEEGKDDEQNVGNSGKGTDGPATLADEEGGDKSSNLPADGERIVVDPSEEAMLGGESKSCEEPPRRGPAKRGRPFGKQRGGSRGGRTAVKLPIEEESDGESWEKLHSEEQSSRRRSSRIETLYGPSGRPIRSAALKRKTVVESGSGSDSDEEPLSKKLDRMKKQSSADECSDVSVRRSLRPRRAAANKKFIMDDSESEEEKKSDEWQQDSDNNEPMDYGEGVAEGGHFLDPVLHVEPLLEEPTEKPSVQPAETTSIQPAETTSVQPAENTSVLPAETTSVLPADNTSVQPAQNTSVQPAENTSVQPPEDTSVQPAEDTSVQPAENTSVQPAENTSVQPAEKEAESIDLNVDNQQEEDVAMPTDVEKISDEAMEESTNQSSNAAADVANEEDDGPVTKGVSVSEAGTSVKNPGTCDIDNADEPATKGDTSGNDLGASHISDVPKEVGDENKDKEQSEAPRDDKTDAPTHNSDSEDKAKTPLEDNENVPFGPKLPIPTLADMEFFRSIIPAMASFNNLQKSELKSSIIATLKEMLNEDLGIEVTNPEADESVKSDSQIPHVETVESI